MSSNADNFIFWSAPAVGEEEDVGFEDEVTPELLQNEVDRKEKGKGKARESMYVALVEGMVKTVLDQESFLFSDEEKTFFKYYSTLSYNARYLLARLLVRKTGKWYRYDQLKYVSELGLDGILEAMKELSTPLSMADLPVSDDSIKTKTPLKKYNMKLSTDLEIIDLTLDEDSDAKAYMEVSNQEDAIILASATQESMDMNTDSQSSNLSTINQKGLFEFFAEDESVATLPELLKCLTVEELKSIAKNMKLSNSLTTRAALVDALLVSASAQTTLGSFSSPGGARRSSGKDARTVRLKQICLSFTPVKAKVQTDVLRGHVLKFLKKCIRINDSINALFHRLHIIYFRSTEHPTSLLTPALLRRCRKRFYPLYTYVRTPEIFTSREALIAYEDALRMEAAVDMMLEDSIDVEVAQAHINAWANGREKTSKADDPPPHTLRCRCESLAPMGLAGKENTPSPQRPASPFRERGRSMSAAVKIDPDEDVPQPVKESRTAVNARYVIEVFERVYPRWQELVRQRGTLDGRPSGLERFDEGYILTRVVYKGAAAYGKLKDFTREIELLEELLSQRRWRRGKRGAWYDRWALVLMHHLSRAKREVDGELQPISKEDQKEILQKAMKVIHDGLRDEDTHIVHRQALAHRLSRLEKRLKVPVKDRLECAGKLQKAVEVKFFGERIKRRKGMPFDKTNSFGNKTLVPVSVQIQGDAAVRKHLEQLKRDRRKTIKEQWKGKSLWVGKCGEEVNVETLALHHYELQGFKGFHSEASIVCTIWGLLFWDILFSSIPGAFETPYQSAPLDIATECFYFARKDVVEKRLQEIKHGKAPEILAEVDDMYRENNTMCVGVRWNDFTKQDLVEIVTCLGGQGLSVICRLFCEDYGGRHSGIPDLIVWRMEDKLAKFVEVKGPGDNLSENQKVWIDVLLQAGVGVEVCRIAESGKGKDDAELAKRRLPKKPIVIRVYRANEGSNGSPIDLDGVPDVESEEELDDQPYAKDSAQEVPPRKRQKITVDSS